jgi:CheY-like chemotaxis protein
MAVIEPDAASAAGRPLAEPAGDVSTNMQVTQGQPATRMLILVVERDPHVRELEAHFLQRAGYVVQFAADGLEALEQARKLQPQIVITEILVPKLDGLALCRRLKSAAETRGIAVLVFSILAVAVRAKEAGADAFLLKPLAEHRLVGTVESLLGKKPSAQRDEEHP